MVVSKLQVDLWNADEPNSKIFMIALYRRVLKISIESTKDVLWLVSFFCGGQTGDTFWIYFSINREPLNSEVLIRTSWFLAQILIIITIKLPTQLGRNAVLCQCCRVEAEQNCKKS